MGNRSISFIFSVNSSKLKLYEKKFYFFKKDIIKILKMFK